MCIDRRDFIKLGALSTVMWTAGALESAVPAMSGRSGEPVAGIDEPTASLARPITQDEYLGRQEQARRYMRDQGIDGDRKSTRLNSSHLGISYAVFCLK